MEEDQDGADMKAVGLIDGHAYSLIKAKEITTKHGAIVRLVLIRNPWGNKEWTGDWSDKSPLWDDHVKKQLPDHEIKNDGCFWMSMKDYDDFFYITTVCYFMAGYKEDTQIYD
jgi:calpain-15